MGEVVQLRPRHGLLISCVAAFFNRVVFAIVIEWFIVGQMALASAILKPAPFAITVRTFWAYSV